MNPVGGYPTAIAARNPVLARQGSQRRLAMPRLKVRLAERVALVLWFLYFPLSSIFIFSSGVPQIADYVFLVLAIHVVLFSPLRPHSGTAHVSHAIFLFAGYAFLVNGVWSLLLEDRSVLTYGFYYAYNGMVAFTTAVLCGWLGRRIVNWTLVSVICGLSLQISVSGIFEIVGARRTLLFNNPVQLAVYAVLLSSIFWVLFPKIHLSRWLSTLTPAAVYGTGAYLAAIAVSRAGVLAMILLILLQSLARAKYMISALVLAGAVLWFGVGDEVSKSVNNRFIDKSQSFTEELQHRGYDRIWHYPEHLLVGAGEGAFERFSDRELHSTYGTVLFSYGIVGSILFARIFWQMFCQYGIASLLYLIPAFAFGSTENGLRHSEFWILIVLICFISYQARSANAGQFLHGRLSSCAVSQRRVRPSRQ